MSFAHFGHHHGFVHYVVVGVFLQSSCFDSYLAFTKVPDPNSDITPPSGYAKQDSVFDYEVDLYYDDGSDDQEMNKVQTTQLVLFANVPVLHRGDRSYCLFCRGFTHLYIHL